MRRIIDKLNAHVPLRGIEGMEVYGGGRKLCWSDISICDGQVCSINSRMLVYIKDIPCTLQSMGVRAGNGRFPWTELKMAAVAPIGP